MKPRKAIRQGMIYQVDKTRESIMATAWDMILSEGFFASSMQDLARRCGVSRTTLYRYFRDKLELGLALAEQELKELDRRSPVPPPGGDAVQAIEDYLTHRWLDSHSRDIYRFLAEFDTFFSGLRIPPDFVERWSQGPGRRGDPRLLELLDRARQQGRLSPDTDIHLCAVALINAIRGTQQRILMRQDALAELDRGEADRILPLIIHALVQGLLTRPSGDQR